MHIGNKIMELRKAKGMTQEQLALKLGISAPAVSKWETAVSYPDITLLCPLARALGTNVDTLLDYEEDLSGEKADEYAAHIIRTKQEQGVKAAEEELEKVLCQYPDCVKLKFNATALFTNFAMQDRQGTDADRHRWEQRKKKLLEEIYESRNADYLYAVISALAALEIQDGRLDEAEGLLKELPEAATDATALWIQLYLKRGQTKEALEILQKRLYVLLSQADACLAMMIEKILLCWDETLELCDYYRKLDGIIFDGGGMGDIVLAAVYGRAGKEREAEHYLKSYLESLAVRRPEPNPLLFPHMSERISRDPMAEREWKEMMLRGIMADECLAELCEKTEIKEILQKIRKKCDIKSVKE